MGEIQMEIDEELHPQEQERLERAREALRWQRCIARWSAAKWPTDAVTWLPIRPQDAAVFDSHRQELERQVIGAFAIKPSYFDESSVVLTVGGKRFEGLRSFNYQPDAVDLVQSELRSEISQMLNRAAIDMARRHIETYSYVLPTRPLPRWARRINERMAKQRAREELRETQRERRAFVVEAVRAGTRVGQAKKRARREILRNRKQH